MSETKENATSAPKMMEGEIPTIKEQIAYMRLCFNESKKDLEEITNQAQNEPEFTEHIARNAELVVMLESILQNLVAFRNMSIAIKAQSLAIDGASLIARERGEHFTKHNRTIERDTKENTSGQLIEGAIILLQTKYKNDREVIAPTGWSQEIFDRMARKSYEKRLVIAGSLIAAQIDLVRFGEQNFVGVVKSKEVSNG
jgi:hypothetical protein